MFPVRRTTLLLCLMVAASLPAQAQSLKTFVFKNPAVQMQLPASTKIDPHPTGTAFDIPGTQTASVESFNLREAEKQGRQCERESADADAGDQECLNAKQAVARFQAVASSLKSGKAPAHVRAQGTDAAQDFAPEVKQLGCQRWVIYTGFYEPAGAYKREYITELDGRQLNWSAWVYPPDNKRNEQGHTRADMLKQFAVADDVVNRAVVRAPQK